MNQHLDDDLLVRFTEGELGEHLAVHVAEHLDGCADCAQRAELLDPLHQAFASVSDPEIPVHLADSILRAAEGSAAMEEHTLDIAWRDVSFGALMLTVAGVLLVGADDPVAHLATLQRTALALETGLSHALGGVLMLQVPLMIGLLVLMAGSTLWAGPRLRMGAR